MKNFKNTVDEIYEFIDELIGSIVPGLYFCSYAIFVIITFVFICSEDRTNSFMSGSSFTMAFIVVVSYVLGTMFRRSNSREPDLYSAKYIYYKSTPIDDNDYAFAALLSNTEYDDIIKNFKELINDERVHICCNYDFINSREHKGSTKEKFNNFIKRKEPISHFYYSKPYILQQIYILLENRLNELNKDSKSDDEEEILITSFIEQSKIRDYAIIHVEYPYGNLKQYLLDRDLKELADYVDWNKEQDLVNTHRSKSFVWNKKLYIKHNSPKDYGHLLKIEAHIRFMNAMWFANKYLMRIVKFMTFFFGFSYLLFNIIIENKLILSIRESNLPIYLKSITEFLVQLFKNILYSIFNTYPKEKFIFCFFLAFLISITYWGFGVIIKKTIINNFHYQRIREIVSVLKIFKLIEQDQLKKQESEQNK